MSYKSESNIKLANDLRTPKMFAVIMHNDDYTTVEFVVDVLRKVFDKNEAEATSIMLDVHNSGLGRVGIYTYDIASTKKICAEQMSNEKGFPLKLTIEEAIE